MPNPNDQAAGGGQRTQAEIEAELNGLQNPPTPGVDDKGNDIPNGGAGNKPNDESAADEAARLAAETEATRKGWKPKDAYDGDPKKWVDAQAFLARGEKFTKNLIKEVDALKRQIAEFEGTKKAFTKFHEETIAKKDAELKATIAALRVERSRATAEGDHEGAVNIEDRIEALQDERKAIEAETAEAKKAAAATPPADGGKATDPVLIEWIEDGNAWFNDEPSLRDYALAVGENLVKGGTPLRGRPFLDEVRKIVETNFPRRFRNKETPPSGQRQSGSEGSNSSRSAAGGAQGKTELDLPEVDRQLMKQFIKEGWTTKEKFLASYFSR